jgi:hypothetical protein
MPAVYLAELYRRSLGFRSIIYAFLKIGCGSGWNGFRNWLYHWINVGGDADDPNCASITQVDVDGSKRMTVIVFRH